ncbi:MAG: Gfo/Idh/MocA family protein [Armatimonadota bacterium]
MIGVGLIGYGYWGPNLARNFARSRDAKLVCVADADTRRLEAAKRDWPDVEVTSSADILIERPDIEAVIIATPTATHFPLARQALLHNKHVWIEKPLCDNVQDAERLVQEAERRNRILLVDHTFVYTEAVRWMQNYVHSGELGELYYIDSIRANLGLFQRDVSVLWDLAPHDLSIFGAVIGRSPVSVRAIGACHAGSRMPDIAYLDLDYGDSILAHLHVSWLSPVKVRRTVIGGSKRMMVFDDLAPVEKVKVYDSGVSIQSGESGPENGYRMLVEYRVGDMLSPALKSTEALATEVAHFLHCIRNGEQPATGGRAGLEVVRILAAAQQSMESDGERVRI